MQRVGVSLLWGILYFVMTTMVRGNNISAMAKKLFIPRIFISPWVEERSLMFLEAFCAKPMRWLSIAIRFCNRINNSTAPWRVKFIATLLVVPFFKISNLFSQIIYFSYRRRNFLLKLKIAPIYGLDFSVEGVELFNNGIIYLKLKERLNNIARVCISGKGSRSDNNWVCHEFSLDKDIISRKTDLCKMVFPNK